MYVYGRSSVSRLRSDAKAVDGLGVGLGKAGGGAMPRVLPVLVEEQDRAKQAGKLGFYNAHQLLQYFLQRSIAGYHLQDTALSVTQRLRPLVLGDVDYGTDEFNEIAGWTENGMAYCVDIPDLAAGMHNSVIHLELRLLTPCRVGYFPDPGLIIRMDALRKCFESRLSTVRVKTQHAITFLGPVPDFAGGGQICGAGSHRTRCPTTCVAEPLRPGHVILAPAQRLFRPLALGGVHHRSNKLELARPISLSMSHNVDMLDGTIWHQQAML